jgi:MFS family permease
VTSEGHFSAPAPAAAPATGAGAYGAGRAWYAFMVLELQILLIGIDLSIVTLLVKPIENALSLKDVGFATVTATPVALGIALVYYPAGLLADSFKRRTIIAGGAVIWMLAAILASQAGSPAIMFAARLLAGIGTGISGPSVFSLITDAFSRTQRAFATSAFTAGLAIGGGLGLATCGALVAWTQRNGTVHLFGGSFAPWQQCFLAVAAAGAIAVLAVLTLQEPPRRDRMQPHAAASLGGALRAIAAYMRRHAALWIVLLFAQAVAATSAAGLGSWAPEFGMRRYGGSIVTSIALLGTFSAAASLLGSVLSGLLAQRLINAGKTQLMPLFLAITSIAGAFASIVFPFMPTWTLAVSGMAVVGLMGAAQQLLLSVCIQETAPNEVRGQIVGFTGILGFIPSIAGATLVAYLAEHVFASHGGLGPAFAWVGGISWVLAAVLFLFCSVPYRRAVDDVRSANAQPAIAAGA